MHSVTVSAPNTECAADGGGVLKYTQEKQLPQNFMYPVTTSHSEPNLQTSALILTLCHCVQITDSHKQHLKPQSRLSFLQAVFRVLFQK